MGSSAEWGDEIVSVGAMASQALLKRLRALRSDRRGNVSIMFALSLVPMFGLIGLAVDYSRAVGVRTSMHAAIDAAALMLSKEAYGLTPEQLQTKATQYFTANFQQPEGKDLVVTPTYTSPTPGNWTLTIKVTAKVDTLVMRWVSFQGSGITAPSQMELAASSTVHWGMKKLELALALDNTGSMASSSKMTELKKAVKSLLETLQKAEKAPGDIKIAIIPFDISVKIGSGVVSNSLIDWVQWDRANGSCSNDNYSSYSSCVNNGKTWTPQSHGNWDGCVRDRTYPYDVQDNPPTTSNTATLYPAFECGSLATALPLTSTWTTLTTKVDQMVPAGNTNVTIGLAWAWHALTAQAPYTGAATPAADLDKVIILLTDGINTEAYKNSNDTRVTSETAINDRTKLACDNVRIAKIKLYTVRVIDGNADLLRSCATSPDMYYDVKQASDLNAAFTAIANSLANLYIAK
jgi:Flp pilus assembly protein TadG